MENENLYTLRQKGSPNKILLSLSYEKERGTATLEILEEKTNMGIRFQNVDTYFKIKFADIIIIDDMRFAPEVVYSITPNKVIEDFSGEIKKNIEKRCVDDFLRSFRRHY